MQDIVQEQGFLKDTEQKIVEMDEDHNTLLDVFEQLQQVVDLQSQQGKGDVVIFSPPPFEDGFNGLKSVMTEIEGVDIDSQRRMLALKQAERLRAKEKLVNSVNEFQLELGSFVEEKKLRKTGGISEIERVRQKKEAETRSAMLIGVKG